MINVKKQTWVYPGCKIVLTYNNKGQTKALYCATHRLDGMVNVRF